MQSRTKRDFDTKFSKMRYYNNNDQEGEQNKGVKSELKSKQEILKVFITLDSNHSSDRRNRPID